MRLLISNLSEMKNCLLEVFVLGSGAEDEKMAEPLSLVEYGLKAHYVLAAQIVSAGGIDQDGVTMPETLERTRQFGLVLRHAERDFKDVGVGAKLVHCADTVCIQGNYPQLDLALDLEVGRQFGEGRCFPDPCRSKKSKNRRTAGTRDASQWPGATDFFRKPFAESFEYLAPVERITV